VTTTPYIHRLTRLHKLLGVGRTKLREDFLLRDRDDLCIPHTNIPRLRTIRLGPKSVGVSDTELRRVVEALEREGAARPTEAHPRPRSPVRSVRSPGKSGFRGTSKSTAGGTGRHRGAATRHANGASKFCAGLMCQRRHPNL
jgi:hypothetical protein